MIVVKFGGTSVGDAAAIERAAAIVRGRLAAPAARRRVRAGGATNALLAIAEQAAKGQLIGALRGVEALRERHLDEARAAARRRGDGAEVARRAERDVRRAREPRRGAVACSGTCTPRSLDAIAAHRRAAVVAARRRRVPRARASRREHVDARDGDDHRRPVHARRAAARAHRRARAQRIILPLAARREACR